MFNKKNYAVKIIVIAVAIIVLAGAYCLALNAFWLMGRGQNKVVQQNSGLVGSGPEYLNQALPQGYTLENYKIMEVLDRSCQNNFECATPGKYLIQSNCPYVSLCLKNKCNVICPGQIQPPVSPDLAAATADWLTYKNENLAFEIKYPAVCQFRKGVSEDAVAAFSCPAAENDNYVVVKNFEVPAGGNFQEVIIKNTIFDGSGKNPDSWDEFSPIKIGENTFYKIKTGRFEGVLSYTYYLLYDNQVLAFSFTSLGVDWTNENLDEEGDVAHMILKQMLSTLKFAK